MSDGTRYKDAKGNDSAKRFWGAIGMGLFMVLVAVLSSLSVWTGNDVGENAVKLVIALGVTAGTLLGIGVVEHLGKKS